MLEFYVRLGVPETQSVLRRLESDLLPLLLEFSSASSGAVPLAELQWSKKQAVTVVMAACGYPGKPRLGDPISGIEAAGQLPDVEIFHAGTGLSADSKLVTGGGRVLSVTALGATLEEARKIAQQGCALIKFEGAQWRRDIGSR